jgi:hypothetical protein
MFGSSFEQNCKECHIAQSQLKMFMSRYLLKYSSKRGQKRCSPILKQSNRGKFSYATRIFESFWCKKKNQLYIRMNLKMQSMCIIKCMLQDINSNKIILSKLTII